VLFDVYINYVILICVFSNFFLFFMFQLPVTQYGCSFQAAESSISSDGIIENMQKRERTGRFLSFPYGILLLIYFLEQSNAYSAENTRTDGTLLLDTQNV